MKKQFLVFLIAMSSVVVLQGCATAKGAAAGAAIGGLSGNASKGARIGASVGTMVNIFD